MQNEGAKLLAPTGVLRAAINTGNRALVRRDGAHFKGISPALATRLAQELGMPLQHVVYEGAGKVFEDAGRDKWDVAFLAIDEVRAQQITFTRPYKVIEATYAVRTASGFTHCSDLDREGRHVLTAKGSAYDLYLTKNLRLAQLIQSGTPMQSFEEFASGNYDAVAGVRASLEAAFAERRDIQILPDALTSVSQAMALPNPADPRIYALDAFVERAMTDGFVKRQSTP